MPHFIIMATINNSELTKELIEGAKIQTITDNVPSELGKTVVPTMEVNPRFFKEINYYASASSTLSGSFQILYIPDTLKHFELKGVQISFDKDSTSDNTLIGVNVQLEDGSYRDIMLITSLSSTARQENAILNLPEGLRIKPGSGVYITGTFTAGNLSRSGAAWGIGYTE